MSAAIHILHGPPGPGARDRLRRRYLHTARRSPGAALWLAPSETALAEVSANLLRSPDAADNPKALLAPNLFTFAAFAEEILRRNAPGWRPLPEALRRLLLDDAARELRNRGELSYYHRVAETRGFLDAAAGTVEELKQAGIGPEDLARAAESLDSGAGRARVAACAAILGEYRRRTAAARRADAEERLRRAAGLIAAGKCPPFDAVRAAFLDGFDRFTAGELAVLRALAERCDEVWVSLPGDGAEAGELFQRPRATRALLESLAPGSHVERIPVPQTGRPYGLLHLERQLFRPASGAGPDDAAGVRILEAPGALGEARMVARAVRELLARGTDPGAIVVT
ncbi:MAG TPA: hypothetical protein VIL46_18835, partial [Gemmataceae bacterium]